MNKIWRRPRLKLTGEKKSDVNKKGWHPLGAAIIFITIVVAMFVWAISRLLAL